MIAERSGIRGSVNDPRTSAMGGGGSEAHDAAHRLRQRLERDGKPGLTSAFQRRVHTLFVEAVRGAGADGVTIRKIGRLLGVSDKTVSAWVQDGREVVIPATRFLELFSREDIFPDLVRERFVRQLCAEMGFYAVPIPEARGGKVEGELCDVVDKVGRVAGKLKAGMADGKLTRDERDGLLEEVTVLGVEVVELAESVRTHGLR